MNLPRFGKKSFKEVKEVLAKRGLSLATPFDPSADLNSLGFSVRINNVLYIAGIRSIEDLTSRTKEELMNLPHFGEKFLEEVKVVLSEKGLSLASTPLVSM